MEAASVRINSELVSDCQGKIVRIIGKCSSYDSGSGSAVLNSGGSVNLNLTSGDALEIDSNYEIIGKVSSSNDVVNVYSVIPLSANLNLELADKLVKYTHKVPELFH